MPLNLSTRAMNGFLSPDGPTVTTTVAGGAGVEYGIPKQTIMVLRGTVQ